MNINHHLNNHNISLDVCQETHEGPAALDVDAAAAQARSGTVATQLDRKEPATCGRLLGRGLSPYGECSPVKLWWPSGSGVGRHQPSGKRSAAAADPAHRGVNAIERSRRGVRTVPMSEMRRGQAAEAGRHGSLGMAGTWQQLGWRGIVQQRNLVARARLGCLRQWPGHRPVRSGVRG